MSTKIKKGMISRKVRPRFCYDKSCHLIYSTYNEKSFNEGYSFFCFGKLKEKNIFKEKEVVHENNISQCYYTPLKGMIRFFMNEDDLWGEANAWLRVLDKLKQVKCDKCGGIMKKRISHHCFNCVG